MDGQIIKRLCMGHTLQSLLLFLSFFSLTIFLLSASRSLFLLFPFCHYFSFLFLPLLLPLLSSLPLPWTMPTHNHWISVRKSTPLHPCCILHVVILAYGMVPKQWVPLLFFFFLIPLSSLSYSLSCCIPDDAPHPGHSQTNLFLGEGWFLYPHGKREGK